MGETGAGIILEQEIDADADNLFTRSWGMLGFIDRSHVDIVKSNTEMHS